MTQSQLNGEIARITGESSATIAALGFGLVEMPSRKKNPRGPRGARIGRRMRRRLKVRVTPTRSVLPPVTVPTPCIAA